MPDRDGGDARVGERTGVGGGGREAPVGAGAKIEQARVIAEGDVSREVLRSDHLQKAQAGLGEGAGAGEGIGEIQDVLETLAERSRTIRLDRSTCGAEIDLMAEGGVFTEEERAAVQLNDFAGGTEVRIVDDRERSVGDGDRARGQTARAAEIERACPVLRERRPGDQAR